MSDPRFRTAALAGTLLVCLGACSNTHVDPGGRVTTADLRAGKLPVAAEVCITGVATYYDAIAATLVVQDQAGAVKFENVSGMPPWGPPYGQHLEICGETRGAQSGMTLANPSIKSLGTADLPVTRRHSPEEWSKGRVDWQWIEVEGIAYAVTIDRLALSTLHMVMQGRRVRVKILGTEGDQTMEHLVGGRVRASGVASRTSNQSGNQDLLLLSPDAKFVVEVSPGAPRALLPVATVADAVRMAGALPNRRVQLRGSIVSKGAGREQWFRDSTGELLLTLEHRMLSETDREEIAAFPVRASTGAVVLEGPLSTRSEPPAAHGVLTSVGEVHALSAREASRALPVKLQAVMTFRQGGVNFVEDRTGGIFVWYDGPGEGGFAAGDMVEVTGVTAPGDFAPILHASHVRRIGPGAMPKPRQVSLDTLYTGIEDGNWVQAEGNVAAVEEGKGDFVLTMVEGVHTFLAHVTPAGDMANHLLDARVRLEGVCGTRFNERHQLIGIQLVVPSIKYVTILRPGVANMADIPETRISTLLQYSPGEKHRVRVRGTATLVDPAGTAFVEDSTAGLRVRATLSSDIQPGDEVEAIGLPVSGQFSAILQNAVVQIGRAHV